jgi:hypothetical protein
LTESENLLKEVNKRNTDKEEIINQLKLNIEEKDKE